MYEKKMMKKNLNYVNYFLHLLYKYSMDTEGGDNMMWRNCPLCEELLVSDEGKYIWLVQRGKRKMGLQSGSIAYTKFHDKKWATKRQVMMKCEDGSFRNFNVAELVLISFGYERPEGKGWEVGHKNHDPLDNRLDNLQWVLHNDNLWRSVEPKSEFGIAFKLKYGITKKSAPALYEREKRYWKEHGNYSWEVVDGE